MNDQIQWPINLSEDPSRIIVFLLLFLIMILYDHYYNNDNDNKYVFFSDFVT